MTIEDDFRVSMALERLTSEKALDIELSEKLKSSVLTCYYGRHVLPQPFLGHPGILTWTILSATRPRD